MLLTCTVADGSLPCRVTRIRASLNCTVSLQIIASATVTATVYHHACSVQFALNKYRPVEVKGQRTTTDVFY